MCIYCDYCVYHYKSTELVSLYTLDIGLINKYYYYYLYIYTVCVISIRLSFKSDKMKPGLIKRLLFDSKLSFIPHITSLKSRCTKSLDLIKVLSNTTWGADRKVLLRLYRALIRSKLDYGCIVYGSARPSYIKRLDTVHNQGLRLCLGAFFAHHQCRVYMWRRMSHHWA